MDLCEPLHRAAQRFGADVVLVVDERHLWLYFLKHQVGSPQYQVAMGR